MRYVFPVALAALSVASFIGIVSGGREDGQSHADHADHARPHRSSIRALSAEQRQREIHLASEKLGPDLYTTIAADRWVTKPGVGVALRLDDGGLFHGPTGPRERAYALSAMEVMLTRKDIVDPDSGLHAAMDHAEHDHCAQAFGDRGGLPADGIDFTMYLHLEAGDGRLVIDDVDADWHPSLDREARECYLSMFRGVTLPWAKTESLWVEYPICINVR